MIINDEEKPQLDSLSHHGVAGMKWGHRKAAPVTAVRTADIQRYGLRGATRIARNRDNGVSLKKAQKKETNKVRIKFAVGLGAVVVGHVLTIHGDTLMSSITEKAESNRSRNSVTALAKDAAKIKYAKQTRGGTYKIHTM